jgi:hypothetical protein
MKIMRSIFILFFLIIPAVYGQDLSFFKEDITFTLDRNYFTVDGFYWFTNQSNKKCENIIYYPFGNSSGNEKVDSVEIYDISKNITPKIINRSINGFTFLLQIAGKDTAVYHIKYIQTIAGDSVKYILTSTQEWNKALDQAEYKLVVDTKTKLYGFSNKPDKVYNIEDKKIYFWKRINFMPTSDMIFHFKYH